MSNQSPFVSYEESVRWLRAQSSEAGLIEASYLDEDNTAAAQRFARSEEFAAVAEWLKLKQSKGPNVPTKKILDVGCGNGIASFAFAGLGHQVTALDPDQSDDVGLNAIQRLVPLLPPNTGSIVSVSGFAEAMPLESETFDCVYARQALHHFSDLTQGIAECARVLKPGGVFLATREHVINDEEQKQQFLANHPLHQKHGGENAHRLSTYLEALSAAHFQQIKALAPFDTIINHFPQSNAQVRAQVEAAFAKRLGRPLAVSLMRLPALEKAGRGLLSRAFQHPGRLYSFVGRKPLSGAPVA